MKTPQPLTVIMDEVACRDDMDAVIKDPSIMGRVPLADLSTWLKGRE